MFQDVKTTTTCDVYSMYSTVCCIVRIKMCCAVDSDFMNRLTHIHHTYSIMDWKYSVMRAKCGQKSTTHGNQHETALSFIYSTVLALCSLHVCIAHTYTQKMLVIIRKYPVRLSSALFHLNLSQIFRIFWPHVWKRRFFSRICTL